MRSIACIPCTKGDTQHPVIARINIDKSSSNKLHNNMKINFKKHGREVKEYHDCTQKPCYIYALELQISNANK